MIRCSVNSLSGKLFIGSLAAVSYRIMYPRFSGGLEYAGDFFERQAAEAEKRLTADFEKRKSEAARAPKSKTEAEIFSLMCDIFECGKYISTVFTFILMRGGKCVNCKRFSFVWDSSAGYLADMSRLGISRKKAARYDGIYISKSGGVIGFSNPLANESGFFPAAAMKNPEKAFVKEELQTKKDIIMTNNENNA